MRILLLLDERITDRRAHIDTALNGITADYKDATPVSWTYETMNMDSLKWVEYQPTYFGIDWSKVHGDMNTIFNRDGLKYDHVIYIVSEQNWKAPGIGGWSLGTPIKGYVVQIVRLFENATFLKNVFAMEVIHGVNDLSMQELGDNLLSTFDTNDFDNKVIHGEDSRYGVLKSDGTYFTDFNYTKIIGMMRDQLTRMYAVRLAKYLAPVAQFIFNKNLSLFSRGIDVVELQKRLRTEGVFTWATNSGYFGLVTRTAVVKYQIKHGISPALGFCGEITRTKLNSTVSASPLPFTLHDH